MTRRMSEGISAVVLAAALAAFTIDPVMAQSGAGKDTKKLQATVEKARKSLEVAVVQVKETMALYSSLFEPDVKKPESIYKKLEKGIEECDKVAKDARKSVDSMEKDLKDFYVGWEEEIAAFTSESMKERGQQSLDKVRSRYERFDAALADASGLYGPFIATLRDHALFLGRDLSPDALAALQEDATKLNDDAGQLYAKVDEALNDTRAGADESPEPTDDPEGSAEEEDSPA